MSVVDYEAILFDFDGVLVDSEPVHFECWRDLLLPHGLSLTWDQYRKDWIGASDRSMLRHLCEQSSSTIDSESLWQEYPRKRQMFRERMLAIEAITEQTAALVRELKSSYKLAVVTSSGQAEVEPILSKSGLLSQVDTVVYGTDVENTKPHPEPYLLACKRLGTRHALAVEDSQPGMQSARAAGLDVVEIPNQCEMPRRVLAHLRRAASTSAS